MPSQKIQKPLVSLAGLSLMLSLIACDPKRIEVARPPAEYTEPVKRPDIPEGQAACPNSPDKRCLTDAQTGQLLLDAFKVIDEAIARSLALRGWYDEVE